MTKIRYPIPYEIDAKFGSNRALKTLTVADEIEVDIRDVSELESFVVMTADMTWATGGLAGQGRPVWEAWEEGVNNFRNPTVEIRAVGGSFYAPVMKFSRLQDMPGAIATPKDLEIPINHQTALATPFERLYSDMPKHLSLNLEAQALGRFPRFEDARIREVGETGNTRASIVEMAEERLSDMIAIDGTLWQKLPAEPRIDFRREYRAVDDASAVGVMVFTISVNDPRDRNAFTTGQFSITQLSDCLEHVEAHFSGLERVFLFENLNVKVEEAFVLSQEHASLIASAKKIVTDLQKASFYLSPALVDVGNRLNWAVMTGKAPDDVADLVSEALPHLGNFPEIEHGARAAADRWNMRPVNQMELGPRI